MFRIAIAALLLGTAGCAVPAEPISGWTVDLIPWQATGANGTRYALLEGWRDRAGVPFSYAFFIPKGVWDGPHEHSATARVFVAKGALRIGHGNVLHKTGARTYPAGSYLVVPAGTVHFDGADEDTVIVGTAIGPWETIYRDGASPASAGTPRAADPGSARPADGGRAR